MSRFLVTVLAGSLCLTGSALSAQAQSPVIISKNAQQPSSAIISEDNLKSIKMTGQRAVISWGQDIEVETTDFIPHQDGFTWVGTPVGGNFFDKIVLTNRQGAFAGFVNIGGQQIKLLPDAVSSQCRVNVMPNKKPKNSHKDIAIPPIAAQTLKKLSGELPSPTLSDSSKMTVIDLMILYTDGIEQEYTKEGVAAGIQNLVDVSNQAFKDSKIALRLNLVALKKTTYPDGNGLVAALESMTYGESTFSNLKTMREEYGADLVSLLRKIQPDSDACGVAWIMPSYSALPSKDYGFSVVDVGTFVGNDGAEYGCDDYTLVHELGHNFGCDHDWDHAYGAGIFQYSYGADVPGKWATIMSYDYPQIGLFSNPNLIFTYHSDTSTDVNTDSDADADETELYYIGNEMYANNAQTIALTKQVIAAYMPSEVKQQLWYPLWSTCEAGQVRLGIINPPCSECSSNKNCGPLTGELHAYDCKGNEVDNPVAMSLNLGGSAEIDVKDAFPNACNVCYVTFNSADDYGVGYEKTVIGDNKVYLLAAQKAVSSNIACSGVNCDVTSTANDYLNNIHNPEHISYGDICIPLATATPDWWTAISLINTTSTAQWLNVEFMEGPTCPVALPAYGQKTFYARDLLGPSTYYSGAATIKNAYGITGAVYFGRDKMVGARSLMPASANTLYFPFVADMTNWGSYFVLRNSGSPRITGYLDNGWSLGTKNFGVSAQLISNIADYAWSQTPAWFKIEGAAGMCAEEFMVSAYAESAIVTDPETAPSCCGTFALFKDGAERLIIINPSIYQTSVTLTYYNEQGEQVGNKAEYVLLPNASQNIYLTGDNVKALEKATHVSYQATWPVVGYEVVDFTPAGASQVVGFDGMLSLK